MISAACNSTEERKKYKDRNNMDTQAQDTTKATIKSLPIDVVIMIIEILRLKDAVELCHALQLPEHVAVQYCYIYENDIAAFLYLDDFKLKPKAYKFMLKNKRFQILADSYSKTRVAVSTLDLEFVKNYIEEVEPDLNEALSIAAEMGFIDAVKLLLSDSRVPFSAEDNYALEVATGNGHTEVVKLLLSDSRIDPSAEDNEAFINAIRGPYLEIIQTLLSDSRVDPSAQRSIGLVVAAGNGHLEIVKLLLSDSRVDPSARNNHALIEAVKNGHFEIAKLIVDDPRFDQFRD
jgi:ankyrin repeat protein